jgi:hypothetical protein
LLVVSTPLISIMFTSLVGIASLLTLLSITRVRLSSPT